MTAAEELVRLLEGLEGAGTSVMALVRQGRAPEPWTLYPDEYGIFDRRTGCQFYFHAHADVDDEAGHIHTVRFFPDHTAHVVAISLDHRGWPRKLFTLNLWAIGDAEEPPERLKRFVRSFRIGQVRGDARLIRFVNLVFEVFRPEIQALQDEKAEALAAWRAEHPGQEPSDDRSLEVLSEVAVDVRQRASVARPA